MDSFSQQIGLVDDCLRAGVYADFLFRQRPPEGCAWLPIADMCYADLIISWNCLFGQNSQETHWKKFVDQIILTKEDNLKLFSKNMLLSYLDIDDEDWSAYHEEMKNTRNVRIAHLNTNVNIDVLPNITIAIHCCYLYRDWLMELLCVMQKRGIVVNVSQHRAKDAMQIYLQQIKKSYSGI